MYENEPDPLRVRYMTVTEFFRLLIFIMHYELCIMHYLKYAVPLSKSFWSFSNGVLK